MALEIRDESVGEILVLDLKGRLDTDTSADLELAVQDLLETGARNFVINLAGVGYVSSAGLRVLLMLGKGVDGSGSLRLVGLNPTVRQVFDVAGFTQLFTILPDREAALAQKIRTTAGKPATIKPEAGKPEASKPAIPEPVPAMPAAARPEAVKPVAAKAEAPRPDAPRPKSAKPEVAKSAASTPEETPVDFLAARAARLLGIKSAAKPGPVMPADQVSRIAQVLSRVR